MIIIDVGLEPTTVEYGHPMQPTYKTKYYIKVSEGNGKEWFVNRDKSYTLEEALTKRDEMLDGIKGRRG